MGKPYTPTTDEVRRDFVMLNETQHPTVTSADLGAEFDRWLNEVKAQAWDESATEACGGNWLPDTNGNPGRPNLSDMKRRNPYRKGS